MRGASLPSFYKIMVFKEKILSVLDEVLSKKKELFLIDISISEALKVEIILDGDKGVTLQDCIDVSKAINNNIDSEEFDYSLEVASSGVSSPLKLVRQYKKNIGRVLKVKTETEKFEATLTEANENNIVLSWKARELKKIGKGKETVEKTVLITYLEIKEAIVTITF